jgi:hypothetical protein
VKFRWSDGSVLMLTDHDPDRNIEDLTDAEIYAAIRYLEPHPRNTNEKQDDTAALVATIIFLILMLGLGLMLLYW